ncbi:MAG: L-serine ammonia-lyase, iron-sulfur-dependent, subunit alpha [Bacillota bacterium]|jgi:L-serine dehydratase
MICSILNDVIGPVMMGPSSSHTAGPCRIGNLARALLDEEILEAEIVFDKRGSFAATYHGQGSDYGFIGGLLGMTPDDEKLAQSLAVADEKGMRYNFVVGDLEDVHPNAALLNLRGRKKEISILARSLGGSMIEIVSLNGRPLHITGEVNTLVIVYRGQGFPSKVLPHFSNIRQQNFPADDGGVLQIEMTETPEQELIELFSADDDCLLCSYVPADLVVQRHPNALPPFIDGVGALRYAQETGHSLWRLAIDYETALDAKEDAIFEDIYRKLKVMRKAAADGLSMPPDSPRKGYLKPIASTMAEQVNKRRLIDGGILNKAMLWAVAVMEMSGKPGVIVAAPTAGSCGVVPAALICVGEQMGYGDEEIAKALLGAGLVGAFIGNNATFAGDVAGCQAEIGAAAAMAAAGLVSLVHGTVAESLEAASLTLQNMLGLVCDPVGCQTEIPCISRNSSGVANAIVAANMVMSGFRAVIPFDEAVEAMMTVGRQMDVSLRCTGMGGLCATATGCRIAKSISCK